MNMIAGYTIQIQSLNNKIKSMGLERIKINISKMFGLAVKGVKGHAAV